METLVEAVATPAVDNGSGSPDVPAAEGEQKAAPPQVVCVRNGLPSALKASGPEWDEWGRAGESLRAECEKNEGGIAWQAAKWLVDGYRTFLGPNASNQDKGRLIWYASRHSGLKRNTLIAYIKVGLAFPKGPMLPELSFAHHRVATLIPNRDDRAYWLRQAASKNMSSSDMKKAAKDLIPAKSKIGINTVQEAERYATRSRNLNPKPHVWDKIISDIDMGRSVRDYMLLLRDMKLYGETFFRNFQELERAVDRQFPGPKGNIVQRVPASAVQERINFKSKQLIEAEKAEATGSLIQDA